MSTSPPSSFTTERVSFDSGETACAGVLYRPSRVHHDVPCVVLAHGFSATMGWIVPNFAEEFARGGLAALIFDYRYLGASGGEPRQLINRHRQRTDLRNAVRFVRSCEGIDERRIALWGTSLGGSHVIEEAASDPTIAAVVANVPGIDLYRGGFGRAKTEHRVGALRAVVATLQLIGAALLDAARGALGLSPHYIPVYGRLGKAVFSDPALADLFRALEDGDPMWRNLVTPRFLFDAPRYRAGTMERIKAPVLVTLARDDEVLSTTFIEEKVRAAPRHEIRQYPVQHFDMYHGAMQAQVAADQLEFLHQHLAAHGA